MNPQDKYSTTLKPNFHNSEARGLNYQGPHLIAFYFDEGMKLFKVSDRTQKKANTLTFSGNSGTLYESAETSVNHIPGNNACKIQTTTIIVI